MPQNDVFGEIISYGKFFLSLPVVLYQGVRQAIWDWNNVAVHRSGSSSTGELAELSSLYSRLLRYDGQALQIRTDLCQRVVQQVFVLSLNKSTPPLAKASLRLVSSLVANEGHFSDLRSFVCTAFGRS